MMNDASMLVSYVFRLISEEFIREMMTPQFPRRGPNPNLNPNLNPNSNPNTNPNFTERLHLRPPHMAQR